MASSWLLRHSESLEVLLHHWEAACLLWVGVQECPGEGARLESVMHSASASSGMRRITLQIQLGLCATLLQHCEGCHDAEAARTDRLGRGAPQKIEPLTGILAKILERKQAIVER